VIPIRRLNFAALGLFMFATQAAAQETRVAAAAGADVIAIYSQQVERRLLRAHFDRAAGRISLVPIGPPGVEKFAVAPNGAFIVYSSPVDPVTATTSLSLLDETGHVLGEPLPSPIGAIARLAVSPKGDRIAASSDKGWMAVLAVTGTGPSRRLAVRAEFGVKADWPFTFAFRPDGGLVILVADWVATWRSNDGVLQRTLDLKPINGGGFPFDGGHFELNWSPRGDRFSVSEGPGPMIARIFDSGGRLLKPVGAPNDFNFFAAKVEFADGGDSMILCGLMPSLVRVKSLASIDFGDQGPSVVGCPALAGGREIALLTDDQITLWSLEGKRLTPPVGLENYSFSFANSYSLGAAAPGAKDEVILAAERSGWVDLYTKRGEFLRRVQTGAREGAGSVALSADGATIAALGSDEPGCCRISDLGVITQLRERAWGALAPDSGRLVAMAANGSRIVAPGPGDTLRSWSRDGAELDSIPLKAGGQVPDRPLSGLAVSATGDAIAVVEEGAAVWLAFPADKTVLRVAQAARSVAPLPDGTGFAIGLSDGTVIRLSRDGTVGGPPVKAFEPEAVQRIVVAPDGQSFIAIDGDERHARHFAWDGKALAPPYRAERSETIAGVFFHDGSPRLISRTTGPATDENFNIMTLAPPGQRQVISLEPPR
jgi:hypothetical protein